MPVGQEQVKRFGRQDDALEVMMVEGADEKAASSSLAASWIFCTCDEL